MSANSVRLPVAAQPMGRLGSRSMTPVLTPSIKHTSLLLRRSSSGMRSQIVAAAVSSPETRKIGWDEIYYNLRKTGLPTFQAAEAKDLIDRGEYILVDVRTGVFLQYFAVPISSQTLQESCPLKMMPQWRDHVSFYPTAAYLITENSSVPSFFLQLEECKQSVWRLSSIFVACRGCGSYLFAKGIHIHTAVQELESEGRGLQLWSLDQGVLRIP